MKKIATMITVFFGLLFGGLPLALAGSVNIYVQDWGTVRGGNSVTGDGNINTVGWTGVAVSQTAGPYLGIYQATGANDPATGSILPVNTVYFTTLLPTQTAPGMFYTTNSAGAGSGGDSAFTVINPTQYTNLALNVEVRNTSATDTNYFAVQVGGSWYVATSYQLPNVSVGYPMFTNATLVYTNPANVWQNLTIGTTNVTIGSVASPNLSAPITGIGIVELPTGGGFNYNQLDNFSICSKSTATDPGIHYCHRDNPPIFVCWRRGFIFNPSRRHTAFNLHLGDERCPATKWRQILGDGQQYSYNYKYQRQ